MLDLIVIIASKKPATRVRCITDMYVVITVIHLVYCDFWSLVLVYCSKRYKS